MTLKCKYCGKNIDGVLPAPLTCWNCYNKEEHETEVINQKSSIEINTIGEPTKECEECHEILPIDEFYKVGKSRNKICKSCVVKVNSKRTLDQLSIPQIRRMLSSGITAESLAKELNRTLSTSQTMLRSLVTTGHAYLNERNGKKLYYLKEEVAEKFIEIKKNNGDNKLKKKSIHKQNDSITILDNGPDGIKAEKIEKEGIIIDNVPIQDISKIIEKLMDDMDASFNFEIITDGDNAQITLSENQIIDWAYKSIGKYIMNLNE